MNLSIEHICKDVLLCRWHKEGNYGDPYVASCVIHTMDGLPYVKGLIVKEGELTIEHVKELKQRLSVPHLYFERDKYHAVKIRKI